MALESSINVEMGTQNQLKISGTSAYAVTGYTSNMSIIFKRQGQLLTPSHCQNRPAWSKACRNSVIQVF